MLNRKFRLLTLVTSLLIGALLTLGGHAQAENLRWNIGLEMGAVQQSYNDVQIPKNTGTRFSLSDIAGNDSQLFYRLELFYELTDKHQLRFLIAPLGYTKNSVLDKNINFDGETFTSGNNTEATYKFNSYRASYRYLFHNTDSWRWHIGGTLKIRDAEIALKQNGVSASNSNIGVVPLLNLYGEYAIKNKWRFIVDFDGLASPQGRALDLGLKINYKVDEKWHLGGGIRILEGGANNDKLYNFAQFNYAFITTGYLF